jgi:hypothetical protein
VKRFQNEGDSIFIFLVVSITLSLISSLMGIGLIFSDSTSFLTEKQNESIGDDLNSMIRERDSDPHIMLSPDVPNALNILMQ